MNKRNIVFYLLLTIIVSVGLWFRLKGISSNHSFWADEALVSSFARDIIQHKLSWLNGISAINYAPLHTMTVAIFFLIFGVSEFTARLPTVLFSGLGIVFAFLVARRLSRESGGILAAFLMAFSQLNLAHATQAKPYLTLQTLFLILIYLLIRYTDHRKSLYLIAAIGITCLASFFHSLGILFWIIVAEVFFIIHHYSLKKLIDNPWCILALLLIIGLIIYSFGITQHLSLLFKPLNNRMIFVFNNSMYLKNLLLRQYGIFLIPAVLSFFFISKKYRLILWGLISYGFVLLFLWNFRSYSHNLRYLISFYGLIFVFFGVFWSWVGEFLYLKFKISNFKFVPILVLIIVYISGDKIVRTPQSYYSPNLDLYGDVQNADYKNMYSWIEKKYGNKLTQIAIFNDLIDTEKYYLQRHSNAYFMKGINPPQPNKVNGVMIYDTLSDFLKQKSLYPKGILIIEDWESFLPENIKQYAKKNLKLEYRVEKMSVGEDRDIWPLEVRSWGMD